MTGLDLLTRLSAAGGACREANARSSDPRAMAQLASTLYRVEAQAHAHLARQLGRSLPPPSQGAIGAWADRMLALPGGRALFVQATAPDSAAGNLQQLADYAMRLTSGRAMQQPQQRPAPQGFGASPLPPQAGPPVASATPAPPADPEVVKRKIGMVLSGVSILGAIGAAVAAFKYEKQQAADGNAPVNESDSFNVRMNAQQVLDTEAPGAMLSLSRTPAGSWMASVRRGRQVIVRHESKKAGEAAERAVHQAVAADALGGEYEAEVIEPKPRSHGKKPAGDDAPARKHEPSKPKAPHRPKAHAKAAEKDDDAVRKVEVAEVLPPEPPAAGAPVAAAL